MKNDKEEIYLGNLFKARFPYIYICSWEESRVIDIVKGIAKKKEIIHTERKVFIWSQTIGMVSENEYIDDTQAPLKALEYIEKNQEPAIFILKDMQVYFGFKGHGIDFFLIRKCRDLVEALKTKAIPQNIILLAPSVVIPESLQKDVVVYDFDLPDLDTIMYLLNEMIEVNKANSSIQFNVTEEDKIKLCKAALGLTYQEAENAFARAIVHGGNLSIEDLNVILEEKCQVIRKNGILDYINTDISLFDIGGLENLKRWLNKRNKSWNESAKKYNLSAPKGILITGVPGCGKSLTAKAISVSWQLPLLKLDMGKIFSGIVGSSEENMRKAIKTAEAVAPSVLWIDEIEKGLSNVRVNGDSGTSARILGTFLTWMQEKNKPVFVIATANDISVLPPELLRKGRFDEIFFVDLPTENERKEIFRLHLEKRLTDEYVTSEFVISENVLSYLASITEGYSGAEIEQVVVEALFEAFADERPLEETDLKKAIHNMVTLSTIQAEQIEAIRQWANERAVTATAQKDVVGTINKAGMKKDSVCEYTKPRGGRFIDF